VFSSGPPRGGTSRDGSRIGKSDGEKQNHKKKGEDLENDPEK